MSSKYEKRHRDDEVESASESSSSSPNLELSQRRSLKNSRSNCTTTNTENIPSNEHLYSLDIQDWIPNDISESIINKKKIELLKNWIISASQCLSNGVEYQPRLMLLSGPHGCGKSSTVQLLIESLGMECIQSIDNVTPTLNDRSILDAFQQFLQQADYASLDEIGKKQNRILVLDGLPNVFGVQQESELESILVQHAEFTRIPSILILSESQANYSAQLFSTKCIRKLLETPFCGHITVNPVPNTVIMKTLKKFMATRKCTAKSSDLEMITQAAQGDLRSALLSLSFHLMTTTQITKVSRLDEKRRKSKRSRFDSAEVELLLADAVGKDFALGTFHAVGKILYNKRLEDGSQKTKAIDILRDWGADSQTVILFLHENYTEFVESVDDLVQIASCMSESISMAEWREDNYNLQILKESAALVCSESLLVYNSNRNGTFKPKFQPIRGSLISKCELKAQQLMENAKSYFSSNTSGARELRSRVVMTDYSCYFDKIMMNKSTQSHDAFSQRSYAAQQMTQSQTHLNSLPLQLDSLVPQVSSLALVEEADENTSEIESFASIDT